MQGSSVGTHMHSQVERNYELCDQPYGCREFGIQDLDGYDIAFGQDIEALPGENE